MMGLACICLWVFFLWFWGGEKAQDTQCTQALDDSSLWGLDRIDQLTPHLDNVFTTPGCNCGNGTHIFIFDTGVRLTHTEFAGRGGLAISFLLDAQNVTDGKCIVRPLDFVEVKTMMMIIMGSPHSLAHSHFRMP